jgi:glutathione S-transferase
MLKIYGTSRSRTTRALWAAEELGLKYEHIPVAVADSRNPDFVEINPNGRIPAIEDDGTVLCESMAINLYLAEKYGRPPFWPAGVGDRGRVFQWSFWSMLECEGHYITAFFESALRPEGERDEKAVVTALEALKKPLKVLDDHLRDRPYLLGEAFTLADLNVAGVLVLGTFFQLDLSDTPRVKAWLDKCLSRPAMQKARTLP